VGAAAERLAGLIAAASGSRASPRTSPRLSAAAPSPRPHPRPSPAIRLPVCPRPTVPCGAPLDAASPAPSAPPHPPDPSAGGPFPVRRRLRPLDPHRQAQQEACRRIRAPHPDLTEFCTVARVPASKEGACVHFSQRCHCAHPGAGQAHRAMRGGAARVRGEAHHQERRELRRAHRADRPGLFTPAGAGADPPHALGRGDAGPRDIEAGRTLTLRPAPRPLWPVDRSRASSPKTSPRTSTPSRRFWVMRGGRPGRASWMPLRRPDSHNHAIPQSGRRSCPVDWALSRPAERSAASAGASTRGTSCESSSWTTIWCSTGPATPSSPSSLSAPPPALLRPAWLLAVEPSSGKGHRQSGAEVGTCRKCGGLL